MRLVLASSAVLIIYIDPSEPDRSVPLTYTLLVLYTLTSAAQYILIHRGSRLAKSIAGWAHWADIGWYRVLIRLSSGTNSSSIIIIIFFFSVIVASFRWGFASGLRVAIAASVLFSVVGYVTVLEGEDIEWNCFLLRPVYLFVLGYMIAYWGGYEITLKRRLELLREITSLSNPRFGVDRTVCAVLEGGEPSMTRRIAC